MGGNVLRSYCRICAPNCGVLITVDGDTVTSVRGDPEHPVSLGYVCPKGRALGDVHHDPRRLDHPEVRVDGALQATSWEATVDDLAGRLQRAIDALGPDAVATYQGTPAFGETAGLIALASLCTQLGTRSRFSSLTVDISAMMLSTGMVFGAMFSPIVDVDSSRFLLVLGTNPVVSHGQYNGFSDPIGRLRRIAERGQVWVVDPRRTETATHASRYVPIRPGADHALLAHVVRAVLHHGVAPDVAARLDGLDRLAAAVEPWSLDRTAAVTGIPPDTIDELVAGVLAAGRLSVMCGTGLTMARSGNASSWLAWALLLVTGSFDQPGGMWVNPGYFHRADGRPIPAGHIDDGNPGPPSRPDLPRFHAEYPSAAMADEILAGNVRALLSFGGNPLVAIAGPERLRRAIAGLDAFAVIGTHRDGQAELASHLLPVTGMLERADANLITQVAQFSVVGQYTPAAVAPVAERRPAWWVVAQLGQRLGINPLPPGVDLATATDDDVLAAMAGGPDVLGVLKAHGGPIVQDGPVTGWVMDRLPRRPDVAPEPLVAQFSASTDQPADTLRLIPRRLLRRYNSVHSPSGRQDDQAVVIHPSDAVAAGVVHGQPVRVRSAHGDLVGPAVVDAGIAAGAVAISHAFADVHVGNLVSATEDLDPLTGMITQTGVSISIEPA